LREADENHARCDARDRLGAAHSGGSRARLLVRGAPHATLVCFCTATSRAATTDFCRRGVWLLCVRVAARCVRARSTPGQDPPQMCPCPQCAKLCPGIAPIFPCPLQCNPKPGLGCLCPTNVTQCNPTPIPPTACGLPVGGGSLKELCPGGQECPDSSTGGTCSFCPDIPTREEEEAAAAYMAAQKKRSGAAAERPGAAKRLAELEALRSQLAALEQEVAIDEAAARTL
jgi:hypothetical protein